MQFGGMNLKMALARESSQGSVVPFIESESVLNKWSVFIDNIWQEVSIEVLYKA